MGLVQIPCIRVDHLSENEQRLLRLAVNRLGEKGRWDLDELKIEFGELILQDAPIEVSGFSLDEIDQIVLDDDASAIEAGPLAPSAGATAIARLGDVFLLGRHRFACGDATDAEVWRRLMDGASAGAAAAQRRALQREDQGPCLRLWPPRVRDGLRRNVGRRIRRLQRRLDRRAMPWLCDGAVFGTFIDWRGYPTVHAAAVKAGLAPLNLIVWGKTNAGMGSLYRSPARTASAVQERLRRRTSTISNSASVAVGGRICGRTPARLRLGRTLAGACKTIRPSSRPRCSKMRCIDLTNRGDVVLDPFLGSGSTLIACEKTGRICRGLELDPLYAEVIMPPLRGADRRRGGAGGHRREFRGPCGETLA